LAQLGRNAALVRRVEAERPWLVAQALLTGATPEQVVETLGWELSDLQFAFRRWVIKLREQNRISDGQNEALLVTVYGGR